jgi:hypothetical protein
MISRPDLAVQGRTGRVVRLSVALSVLVHLAVLLLAFGAYDVLERLAPHRVAPKHDDETVTMSTAFHFERRPRAMAAHPSGAAAGRPRPVELTTAKVAALQKPATAPPPRARPRPRELAKTTPRATPQPRAKRLPPRQIALAQHAPATDAERPPGHPAALSAAKLAQIQNDLAASIAHDRARENPLSNVARRVTAASTFRRYAINVAGTHSLLRGAQGLCGATQTWNANGFVYFYVTCRTQRADGSVRNEVIPWPLRYRPSEVAYGPSGPEPPPGEIPLPLPGWRLRPAQYVDPDVLDFLRERQASSVAGTQTQR